MHGFPKQAGRCSLGDGLRYVGNLGSTLSSTTTLAHANVRGMCPSKTERETLLVEGVEVSISNPRKLLFPAAGYSKLDLVQYYLSVAEGALRGAGGRPNVLVRYVNGVDGEFFYQKRAPDNRPDWLEIVRLVFPSGHSTEELVPRSAAALAWMANLGCIELHPHPVRAEDLEHPDELRVDLDPMPGVSFGQLQEVARVCHAVLDDMGLTGWPKTSGSRGIHILVRLTPRYGFAEVRRAALALAREVERRAPSLATSKWWKEERHGVFLDYNQNAKDRTVASAYAVRPTQDARVSAPVTWDELDRCALSDFTLRTMPRRFAELGDRHAGIDAAPCSLDKLLELSARQEAAGLGDAPWPPHYEKQAGEPRRVMPSRAKKPARTNTPVVAERTSEQDRQVEEQKKPRGREPKFPLLEIGRAAKKVDVLAGLERWKARHPEVAAKLAPTDVLVDSMRGRSSTWYRVRVNLQHVPEAERPPQTALDPDQEPKPVRQP
ncbi:MAG: ATP-dependent ligase [Myxococcaceae bacterium]|nr:ATP-dependent ligase [Myxococcaceae bacterium]